MILYVNGDSHSVGHGIKHENGITTESSEYQGIGEAPIPENFPYTYGALLADRLGADHVNQGRSGGSIARVIRTTKQFVYQTRGEVFLLLGWPSMEREEWFHNGAWYPINAGGYEVLPLALQQRYKEWVANWRDDYSYYERQKIMYHSILNFHLWLKDHNVKHLMFHFNQVFLDPGYDFGDNFVGAYADEPLNAFSYANYLMAQGYKHDDWGHFGEDGHRAWADYLLPHIQKLL